LDSEKRIAKLCHAVLEAERQKVPYGLQLPGVLIRPGLGRNHRHRCLKALALMEAASSRP